MTTYLLKKEVEKNKTSSLRASIMIPSVGERNKVQRGFQLNVAMAAAAHAPSAELAQQ